jgi:hypothetical protein
MPDGDLYMQLELAPSLSRRYDYKIPKTARVGFNVGMSPPTDSPPIDLDRLSNAELKRLVEADN